MLGAVLASASASAAPMGGIGAPRGSDAECFAAFNQSPAASQGCTLLRTNAYGESSCFLEAVCKRSDGSENKQKMYTNVETVRILQNCNGELGANC